MSRFTDDAIGQSNQTQFDGLGTTYENKQDYVLSVTDATGSTDTDSDTATVENTVALVEDLQAQLKASEEREQVLKDALRLQVRRCYCYEGGWRWLAYESEIATLRAELDGTYDDMHFLSTMNLSLLDQAESDAATIEEKDAYIAHLEKVAGVSGVAEVSSFAQHWGI
jgi:hypothetical protein